jgi:hypothetical protein
MVLKSNRIKESLRVRYAGLANAFAERLHELSTELASIQGPLEVL